ncbi:hypothetical protein ASPVEDRAFT_363506 [Aspergillus versicolor CBS 583.65]|uniref:Uncharacterized protein n=1 Tax=Aspergillus versicolor CBS 583.65 TaxID=1036611 RepID=A0A1L9Q0S8_ASPVE|nr:uncharacterized protein ASPVEDRAFT_363506 [Aspergillus versicolor CBS 583.65]OJJ07282.1 hypothetical protein ASPVEDRAFT_363506 [Aspergillus versicolor CBS 583.65]
MDILWAFHHLRCWIIYGGYFHPLNTVRAPFWASVSGYWLPYQVATGKAGFTIQMVHEQLPRSLRSHEVRYVQHRLIRAYRGHHPRRGVRGRSAIGATHLESKSGFTKYSHHPAEHTPWGMDLRARLMWFYPHNGYADAGVYSPRYPADVSGIVSTTVGVPIPALLHGKPKKIKAVH